MFATHLLFVCDWCLVFVCVCVAGVRLVVLIWAYVCGLFYLLLGFVCGVVCAVLLVWFGWFSCF